MRFESLGSLLEIVGASAQPDVVSLFLGSLYSILSSLLACAWLHLASSGKTSGNGMVPWQAMSTSAASCRFVFEIPSVPPVLA